MGSPVTTAPTWAQRTLLLLTLTVVLAALASGPLLAARAPALPGPAAQVPGGQEVARVTLTDVRPAVAEPGETLIIAGTLRNTGETDLVDPLPALRWSSDPLQTVDEVELVSANPLFRYGRIDYRYSQSLDTLGPGEQAPFRLAVPVDELGVDSGVYVVGVDVLASLPDGLRVFVADARTTIPFDLQATDPLPVAVLWPLATAPALLPNGQLSSDDTAVELAPGGRLRVLLDAAQGTPVTWVVDPDLLATTQAMADGYDTVAPGGPGTGADEARQFTADLRTTLRDNNDVRQVPAADPDVGGALAAGVNGSEVEQAVAGDGPTLVDTTAGRAVPVVSMLADRPVTSRMLGSYLRAGVGTNVLSSASVSGERTDGRARVERRAARNVDAVVARVPPTPGRQVADALHLRQWMLATSAVQATARDRPLGMVVAPGLQWDPDPAAARALLTAWTDATWVQPVGMGRIPADQLRVVLADDQPPAPIDEQVVAGLTEVAADVERLQPLFPEPILPPDEVPVVTARALSYAWHGTPEDGVRYTDQLAAVVTGAEQQIELVVSPSITLSSRSGRFPITMVNESAVDVVVGVTFASQNSSRLRVEDIEPVVLDAGEKRTVNATALATANGRLQVTAQLVTTANEGVGSPARTIVDVTNVGALGWTVIGLGGVLLVAALVRARLKARRARAEPA